MKAESHYRLDSEHHGLLGTVIRLSLTAIDATSSGLMERVVVAEIERLHDIFNAFDRASQISRWKAGEIEAGPEIDEVLSLAEKWRVATRGAFDPHVGTVRNVWATAAKANRLPTARALAAARTKRTVEAADLNGIAKGWIVDCATTVGLRVPGAMGITVNAGGDIRHEGPAPLRVLIEDPHRPYDNVPPLERIELRRGALASSGGARRGWMITGEWFSHVIDARTGRPASEVAQASVIAPKASTADAIATALTVMSANERSAMIADLDEDIPFLVIGADKSIASSRSWESLRVN